MRSVIECYGNKKYFYISQKITSILYGKGSLNIEVVRLQKTGIVFIYFIVII